MKLISAAATAFFLPSVFSEGSSKKAPELMCYEDLLAKWNDCKDNPVDAATLWDTEDCNALDDAEAKVAAWSLKEENKSKAEALAKQVEECLNPEDEERNVRK